MNIYVDRDLDLCIEANDQEVVYYSLSDLAELYERAGYKFIATLERIKNVEESN